MKKSELAKQYMNKSTSVFTSASIGLTVSSALVYIASAITGMNDIVSVIFQVMSIAFMIFAYVMTVKGFSLVNKSYKNDDNRTNYYFGRNMVVFSVLSIVLSIIFEIVAFGLYMMLSVYSNEEAALSADDAAAAGNLKVIIALVVIATQLVSIAMPYIFYMWHIHKTTSKGDKTGTFALLAMLVMIVQSAIVILNSAYSIKGADLSFLSSFAEILKVIEFLVLTVFFVFRRKSLKAESEQITE